jgi:hypothetical protein
MLNVVEYDLLGFDAMKSGGSSPTFRTNILPSSSLSNSKPSEQLSSQ